MPHGGALEGGHEEPAIGKLLPDTCEDVALSSFSRLLESHFGQVFFSLERTSNSNSLLQASHRNSNKGMLFSSFSLRYLELKLILLDCIKLLLSFEEFFHLKFEKIGEIMNSARHSAWSESRYGSFVWRHGLLDQRINLKLRNC